MAKINKVSRSISYHRVEICVKDPDCIFSIDPEINFQKIFKSNTPNSAIKEAANYCMRSMKEYPGTTFTYSTTEVMPYNYYENIFKREE